MRLWPSQHMLACFKMTYTPTTHLSSSSKTGNRRWSSSAKTMCELPSETRLNISTSFNSNGISF